MNEHTRFPPTDDDLELDEAGRLRVRGKAVVTEAPSDGKYYARRNAGWDDIAKAFARKGEGGGGGGTDGEGIPGPPGPEGPQGPQGEPGPAGADGADGAQGPQGDPGPQGDVGPMGPQGDPGADGADGATGATGATGPEGPQGPQGIQGPQGVSGSPGPQGETGPQGPPGADGSPDTAAQVLAKLVTVDGAGSGLDADLLDGQHGAFYAPIASPTFTGDPKAPTPATADNDTSIATTAYVKANVAALVGSASTGMDTLGEIENYIAANITPALGNKADIFSPTFTGDPKAPTPTAGDNDTSIATTAFVAAADDLRVLKAGDTMTGVLATSGSTGTIASATPQTGLMVKSLNSSNAAYLGLERIGAFGALLGMDLDNSLRFGGWSNGAASWKIFHEGICPSSTSYCKWPSGLMYIMGGATSSSGDMWVVFPVAFPTACLGVVVAPYMAGGALATTAALAYNIGTLTNSQFTLQPRLIVNGGNVGLASNGFLYIAWGN